MPGGTPTTLEQVSFRARGDTVGLNVDTWDHALNANFSHPTGEPFRVRFTIAETTGGMANNIAYSLQFNRNGAGFVAIGDAAAVRSAESALFDHLDPTTQLISSGTFVAGAGVTETTTTNISLQNSRTEIEWCLLLDPSQVNEDDAIVLRVVQGEGTVLSTYTNSPTITAEAGAVIPDVEGDGSADVPMQSASGSGTFEEAAPQEFEGAGSAIAPMQSAAGAGEHIAPTFEGAGSVTIPMQAASGEGSATAPGIEGDGTATVPMQGAGGVGEFVEAEPDTVTGAGAAVIPFPASSGTGEHAAPAIEGEGSTAVPFVSASGAGEVEEPPADLFLGSGAVVIPFASASGLGEQEIPDREGAGSSSVPMQAASGVGGHIAPGAQGEGAAIIPFPHASGTGEQTIPDRAGDGAATIPATTALGGGDHVAPVIEGQGGVVIPFPAAAGGGGVSEMGPLPVPGFPIGGISPHRSPRPALTRARFETAKRHRF